MKYLLLTVALAGGLAACSRGGNSPEATIEELARVSESGRCDRVPQLIAANGRELVGPALEAACKEEQQKRKANPQEGARKLKQVNVLNRTGEGDRVTLRAEPEYQDGSKESAQDFVMVREDGEWKIDLLATGMAAGGAKQQ